jgi:tetratricopeptide (TPR) repeat protein
MATLAAAILVILAGLFLKRASQEPVESAALTAPDAVGPTTAAHSSRPAREPSSHRRATPDNSQTAQEIVANKVIKFGKIRRELVHKMAKHFNVEVPDEVERFFAAVEGGRWEEIDAAHRALLLNDKELNQPRSAELHEIWRPIQETWGAAREAHTWPAQTLLNYGNAILDSLRPGMIYAGGTDPGCFIPTMLNETGDSEPRIVLTQNALADGTYINYLGYLYGDRMATLTQDDSQRGFQEYLADAQKRLQHDQQNPGEPSQIKPGEDVRGVDDHVQVSGQVAVMAINEKLFQMLMAKNPGASFAMEESFPFASMYATSTPLGPIMEMGVQDEQSGLTTERAQQSVDYWRAAAQQLLADPEIGEDSDARKAYSKLISSQAGLLVDRKFTAEAEQEFRLANELYPGSPEAVFRYVNLLLSQNRAADALPLVEGAMKAAPDNEQFQALLKQLKSFPSQGLGK